MSEWSEYEPIYLNPTNKYIEELGLIKVRCKYYTKGVGCYKLDSLPSFKSCKNLYFDCDQNNYIHWSYFITNINHLVEVK